MINYLTIDVEDYFQVSAFEEVIAPKTWDSYPSRVERNTQIILDLLVQHNIKATFFIVGWIAERFPKLVKKVHEQGHEVGCHSYWHRKVYDLTPEEFKKDTQRAKYLIEGIIGESIKGYRAPSYSITRKSLWALDILAKLDFTYDSSIFPTYHDNYGIPDAPRFAYKLDNQQMIEHPISTARLLGRNLPVSGGGYFRLFPYKLIQFALKQINNKEKQPFIFYLHPWEMDPDQPLVKNASRLSKFRHYVNLNTTQEKFIRLLNDFKFGPIGSSETNPQ